MVQVNSGFDRAWSLGLKPKDDRLLSTFPFNFNLRRYTEVYMGMPTQKEAGPFNTQTTRFSIHMSALTPKWARKAPE